MKTSVPPRSFVDIQTIDWDSVSGSLKGLAKRLVALSYARC